MPVAKCNADVGSSSRSQPDGVTDTSKHMGSGQRRDPLLPEEGSRDCCEKRADEHVLTDRVELEKVIRLIRTAEDPQQKAALVEEFFYPVLKNHSTVLKTLCDKELLFMACELLVSNECMNSKLVRDIANNLRTVETIEELNEDQLRFSHHGGSLKARVIVCLIANAAKVGQKGILQKLALCKATLEFCEIAIVRWTIEYQWHFVWKWEHIRRTALLSATVLVYTPYLWLLSSLHDPSLSIEQDMVRTIAYVLLVLCFFLMLYDEYRRIKSFLKDKTDQINSTWQNLWRFLGRQTTALDLASCFLLVVALVLYATAHFIRPCLAWLLRFAAFEYIIVCMQAFQAAAPFRISNHLVRTITEGLKAIVPHVCFLFALSVPVCSVLRALYTSVEVERAKCSTAKNLLGNGGGNTTSLLVAFFGGFNFGESQCGESAVWIVLPILLFASLVIVAVNVFSARTGQIVHGVQEKRDQELLMSRADAIDSCESRINDSEREEINKGIGRYLTALVDPYDESLCGVSSSWIGSGEV